MQARPWASGEARHPREQLVGFATAASAFLLAIAGLAFFLMSRRGADFVATPVLFTVGAGLLNMGQIPRGAKTGRSDSA